MTQKYVDQKNQCLSSVTVLVLVARLNDQRLSAVTVLVPMLNASWSPRAQDSNQGSCMSMGLLHDRKYMYKQLTGDCN